MQVWAINDTSLGTVNETRVSRTREGAKRIAISIIEEYSNDSRVANDIDSIVQAFKDAADAPAFGGQPATHFGAGDDNCVFYVSVDQVELED